MKRTKILGLALVAVFAMSALAAGAAQAERPVWIVKASGGAKKVLAAGETRKVTSKKAGTNPFVLDTTTANIVCKKFTNTGEIIGGKPGTDLINVTFEECSVETEGKLKTVAECGASNTAMPGVIKVEGLKTVLVWDKWEKQRKFADDAFFPSSGALFVHFELSGTKCGALEEKEVKVTAVGTKVVKVGGATFERNCGVLGEVGEIEAGAAEKFKKTETGTVVRKGGLNFNAPTVKKGEIEETTEKEKYTNIECKLEALGDSEASLTGTALVELATAGEEFGFE
jgi:hypothetical protein